MDGVDNFLVESAGGGNIGTQVAGTPFNIQVTGRDFLGNTGTSFTGTVDITSTGTLSAGSGTTASFSSGVLSSHSVTISNTGSFTVTATLTAGTENGTSNSFTVDAGPLDHFVVEAQGGGAIGAQGAGVAFNIQITAQDSLNNTVTAFTGAGNTADITSTGTLSAGGGATAAFTNGLLASHSVTITNLGSFTITATDSAGGLGTGSETGVSNSFTVDPGPVDHFVVEAAGGGAIGTQTAAVAFNIQITAEDSVNNTVTAFTGAGNTVDITSSGTLSAGSGTTATFVNGVLASHSVTLTSAGRPGRQYRLQHPDHGGRRQQQHGDGLYRCGQHGGHGVLASHSVAITNTGSFTITSTDTSTGTLSAGGGATATFTNGVLASPRRHSPTVCWPPTA